MTNSTFTGFMHLIDKDDDVVFAEKIDKGITDDKLFFDKEFKNKAVANKMIEDCSTYRINNYIDWYKITTNSDGTQDIVFSSSQLVNITYQTICYTYFIPSGGGGFANTGNGEPSPYDCGDPLHGCIDEVKDMIDNCGDGLIKDENGQCVPDEIIIDSSFLNTKAVCVYNKLQELSTGFKNAIKKFDGEFPVAHLKFSIDSNLPDSTNAVTNNSGTFYIEISVNGNTLSNRTVLGLARTLIHETIHAEMYRKLRSVNYSVSINDFPGIYDYYSRYKDWQHEEMAAHYITTMVDMLKDFDNYQHSNQFYTDLAWEGLQNTVSWQNLSSSEKNRIISTVLDYKNNGNKNCN